MPPYTVSLKTIAQVLNAVPVQGRDIMNATIVFDKTVPNGESFMVVSLDDKGRDIGLFLWPVRQDAQGKRVDLGQPTTSLNVQWRFLSFFVFPADLPGAGQHRAT